MEESTQRIRTVQVSHNTALTPTRLFQVLSTDPEKDQIAHGGFLLLMLEGSHAEPQRQLTLIVEMKNRERQIFFMSSTARRRNNQKEQ